MAVSNMNLIRALVSQLRETQALACGGGGCGGGGCGGGGCGGGGDEQDERMAWQGGI